MGFAPQLVDINGDGLKDIISGSYCGDAPQPEGHTGHIVPVKDENGKPVSEIFAYYRQTDGTYADRVHVAISHIHSACSPVDWDGDGDFDLITAARIVLDKSSGLGLINLMENIGSRTEPRFARPVNLLEGLEIKTAITSAEAFDWDGDGLLDLLAGTEWGDILWFRNEGTKEACRFAEPTVLKEGSKSSKAEKPWGNRLAIFVTDWDGDGVYDIIAGDARTEDITERFIKEEDRPEYEQLKAKVDEYSSKVSALYEGKNYRRMNAKERAELTKSYQKIKEEYSPYTTPYYRKFYKSRSHGYVWIFRGIRE